MNPITIPPPKIVIASLVIRTPFCGENRRIGIPRTRRERKGRNLFLNRLGNLVTIGIFRRGTFRLSSLARGTPLLGSSFLFPNRDLVTPLRIALVRAFGTRKFRCESWTPSKPLGIGRRNGKWRRRRNRGWKRGQWRVKGTRSLPGRRWRTRVGCRPPLRRRRMVSAFSLVPRLVMPPRRWVGTRRTERKSLNVRRCSLANQLQLLGEIRKTERRTRSPEDVLGSWKKRKWKP